MQIRVNDSAIRDLETGIASAGRYFTPALANRILADAAKPMLAAAKAEAPVGNRFSRGKGRLKADGAGDGTYDHGGATRRDARIWARPPKPGEVARLLVGISSRKGKVGWRTHFITEGSLHNRKNDFLKRAEAGTINEVQNRFGSSAQTIVARVLTRFAR